MRIQHEPVKSSGSRPQEKSDEKPSKSFSKELHKKAGESKRKPGDESEVPPQTGAPPNPQRAATPASEVKGPQGAVPVPAIERLAAEITIIERGADLHEVHIQFDSKTLNGLRVQLTREAGQVSIRFLTRSDETANLIAHHVPQLAQSLQSKGVQVGEIQLQTPNRREQLRGQRVNQKQGREGRRRGR